MLAQGTSIELLPLQFDSSTDSIDVWLAPLNLHDLHPLPVKEKSTAAQNLSKTGLYPIPLYLLCVHLPSTAVQNLTMTRVHPVAYEGLRPSVTKCLSVECSEAKNP